MVWREVVPVAERRMFAKTIIESDAFIDMPSSAQALYIHLGMLADDDGFVNSPKMVTRMLNASDDDMQLLITKKFVIAFDSGVVVIKHWKINNYLRSDRYTETKYHEEKAQLIIGKNNEYTLLLPDGIPKDYQRYPQVRLGKDRLGKEILMSEAASGSEPKQKIPFSIILKDGSFYEVQAKQVERWAELFPAVDVGAELVNMIAWSEANPEKRKTRRGATQFINNWLTKSQRERAALPRVPSDGELNDKGQMYLAGKWVNV